MSGDQSACHGVIIDRDTGRSRGFAFVQTATSEAADAAVRKFAPQETPAPTVSGLAGIATNP